ncbi:MAG TPA: 2-polyprenyl-3-methyl-6-methoxy-1,4-benzoquinone monooxygenase [Usitatibacter sp.]|nr:2-polyprenyl-3-methyl-6-methoxy-1,4-benzoquinone monooxygenase [Usitatibacter sp.]
MKRRYGFLDQVLIAADEALRTLAGGRSAARPSPAADLPEAPDPGEAARLMRVNHTGEVCAQALYSGQALFARDERVREALQTAAAEERDHLSWCRKRLEELNSHASVLDPLWYAGSFGMGMVSGLAGDRWSLGFLAETEAQVERHLEGHLDRLAEGDERSRAVLEQMRQDENRHGAMGRSLGGEELPLPVKMAMRMASKVMTRTAYWV